MAKRQQHEPKPANLTAEQMRAALPALERRLVEAQEFDPERAARGDNEQANALRLKVDDTLVEIFGNESVEYIRYCVHSLYSGPIYIGGTPYHEQVEAYERGKADVVTKLQTIIGLFKEKLDGLGETAGSRAIRVAGARDLHPEIRRAAEDLFRNGHYANAVEDACKALDGFVKFRSSRSDLSGTDLMNVVFSAKNPILKFNDGVSESDKSEQQGMMQLFAGAMLAFRNPRAHRIVTDDPDRALEILSFLSFLAKAVDGAKRIANE
jgi:uncharacterized protein (TIGR02391 family)